MFKHQHKTQNKTKKKGHQHILPTFENIRIKVKIGTDGWDRTELDTETESVFWLKLKLFSSVFSLYLTHHTLPISSLRVENRHWLCPPKANSIPYFRVHEVNVH